MAATTMIFRSIAKKIARALSLKDIPFQKRS